jgi:arylsulfatase A-like enzyme
LQSGRFPYHVNQLILSSMLPGWDMPKEMTAMPKKLKQAGYSTHMVGMSTPEARPACHYDRQPTASACRHA